MAGGSRRGIADDADAYAELPGEPRAPPRGIADDAEAFAELHEDDPGGPVRRSLDSPWLFRRDGAVFGPVPAREVLELLYAGELQPSTEVAPEDGDFLPLARFGAFRAHVPKAEAAQRAREAAAARVRAEARAQRLRRLRWAGVATLVAVLGSGLVYGGVWWRRAAAAAEAKALREAQLEAELIALLEGVSIEPPLKPLVSGGGPEEAPRAPTGRRSSNKSRRSRRSTKTAGVLADAEVMQGVERAFGGLATCIKAQLRRAPDSVPETITLRFGIDNSGLAKDVTFRDRFLRRSAMRACFEARLSEIRWRAYEGEVRNVEYPITVRRPS